MPIDNYQKWLLMGYGTYVKLFRYLLSSLFQNGWKESTTRLRRPCHAESIEVAQLTIYMTSNIVDL